jgi:hypothetical protein
MNGIGSGNEELYPGIERAYRIAETASRNDAVARTRPNTDRTDETVCAFFPLIQRTQPQIITPGTTAYTTSKRMADKIELTASLI